MPAVISSTILNMHSSIMTYLWNLFLLLGLAVTRLSVSPFPALFRVLLFLVSLLLCLISSMSLLHVSSLKLHIMEMRIMTTRRAVELVVRRAVLIIHMMIATPRSPVLQKVMQYGNSVHGKLLSVRNLASHVREISDVHTWRLCHTATGPWKGDGGPVVDVERLIRYFVTRTRTARTSVALRKTIMNGV